MIQNKNINREELSQKAAGDWGTSSCGVYLEDLLVQHQKTRNEEVKISASGSVPVPASWGIRKENVQQYGGKCGFRRKTYSFVIPMLEGANEL
jgi:hypothetical protein